MFAGAFIIPFFIMLIVVGMPLLLLELGLGQKLRVGAAGAWKKVRLATKSNMWFRLDNKVCWTLKEFECDLVVNYVSLDTIGLNMRLTIWRVLCQAGLICISGIR